MPAKKEWPDRILLAAAEDSLFVRWFDADDGFIGFPRAEEVVATEPYVPARSLQELRDAAQGVLPDDGMGDRPPGFVEIPGSRLRALERALKQANEVLGGEQ